MADSRFDVATIGNAIVDIITRSDDKFLQDQELIKGAMTLIDAGRASCQKPRLEPGAGHRYIAASAIFGRLSP